ncbi:MAG: hypothetical protein K9G67_13000 [Bacteroidales bacterium]|nr:hypothetical protein [Bacteroidales bacterium]MCF8343186.1 hypothetical protein [Bacteroidales bacterium]MCF8351799.1 hypothetical protein [Bacteroidales bacterium]MCF8377269.1 hypothetical protein [Bacteroidales bacterium]MCF8401109.1 hypothetical protein [Bacteroidales bacterium]
MKYSFILVSILFCLYFSGNTFSQKDADSAAFSTKTFSGLELRSIGPAFKSGRIADIALHPEDNSIWYLAVGSGGVWKTLNAGTTWEPIFDDQSSYSIGCIAIDPNNPNTIWVGTGENVGGRHVGYGDGIYRSEDGGKNWKNMGLKKSEHISKIIIHPENSDIIWVAAQGPLWNKGDQRGLYKSVDGGQSWEKTLGDDEWIGLTDILIDPRNPDRLYAATWQRHRNVAAYMGGGPGTGLYRSEDGGESWTELKKGLPSSDMGKIGLAISPQNPDVLYAATELDRRSGGVYRSNDRGASWKKQSEAVAGATGPHYYQELYASPHEFDKLFLVDVRMQVSEDGGQHFVRMNEKDKHSDNHAIAFREDDPDYMLVGTDGGLYETFDATKTWRFVNNLPVTQFYKLALDEREPFYHIIGGTQDNGTQGGPSRTDKRDGISNEDWYMVLGGDGHQPATEPGNPDIAYAESQEGHLHRIDMTNGEQIRIQPQPAEGEDYERFNWDSPILISPHDPARLYFASQRLWRSDNRGDSWRPVSGDLTKNQDRMELPIMDKTQSWDAAWDFEAMSNYNSITSIAESPLKEGLIYVGTDDGLIQITENGGENWNKIEVGSIKDIPETAFVNDIKADKFDENTLYVALDNHKFGDFNPYLIKSTDRGNSWKSIAGNLPERTLVWRVVQDHIEPELMFAATEFGIYFTINGGKQWAKLSGGVPTISFRDIAIHEREDDLVGASFGRGFYILDDYSLLRHVSEDQLKEKATLFPVKDAWWYIQRYGKSSQGASFFTAPNPPYGAVFTYHLAEGFKTKEAVRKKKEKKLLKQGEDVVFPGWEKVEAERREEDPRIILTVRDSEGKVVRRIDGKAGKGFHRVNWDLRYSNSRAIDMYSEDPDRNGAGLMAIPGTYYVSMASLVDGQYTQHTDPVEFEVKQMRKGYLQGKSRQEIIAYLEQLRNLREAISAADIVLEQNLKKVAAMKTALFRSEAVSDTLLEELDQMRNHLLDIEEKLSGQKAKREVGEKTSPTIYSRYYFASSGAGNSYGPTQAQLESLELTKKLTKQLKSDLDEVQDNRIPKLMAKLIEAGAPWIEGQEIRE